MYQSYRGWRNGNERSASVGILVQLQSAFQLDFALCPVPCQSLSLWLTLSASSVCLFAWLSVCSIVHSPFVSEFAAMSPTPQPTDDVDIYFETPADDKEHSRFQRAKEQLEIRHRNRMERVSYQVQSGHNTAY